MKKILYFITQSEFGGAQRYVFDLANNLKDEYEIAVAMGEPGENSELAKLLKQFGIKYFVIPHLKRSISPFNEIMALVDIVKLIKRLKPDIIHLNSSKISILGSLAKIFASFASHSRHSRYVYTVHGWVFNEPLPAWLNLFYKWAEKLTVRFKDKIICVSDFDRKIALKEKIAPAEKLVTIHNGLRPINFYSKEQARKLLGQISNFKFPISNFIIGSIGHLYKTKGYEYLIEAANILINREKMPLIFTIIGDGKEKNNLEKIIKQYKLADSFILLGKIKEAAKLLPAFNIYICSSVKEGFPYSILEAMSAGLPIVATEVGGIPEMITDNYHGLLINPAKPDEIADKIKLLSSDKNLQIKLGTRSKMEINQKFPIKNMVEETRKIYKT